MQITPANHERHRFDASGPSGLRARFPSLFAEQYPSASLAEFLDVEIQFEAEGLRLLKIGANSPLRRLAPSGDAVFEGAMEMGDRIVAINGVLSRNFADVSTFSMGRPTWEITIYDHRTCLTVSWHLNVREVLQAA
jgi:hypothetical protein